MEPSVLTSIGAHFLFPWVRLEDRLFPFLKKVGLHTKTLKYTFTGEEMGDSL
jgi:hypothetical protein